MDTPKSLRDQARQWRVLADHHDRGTADALLEAACTAEQRASKLERTPRTDLGSNAASMPSKLSFAWSWFGARRRD